MAQQSEAPDCFAFQQGVLEAVTPLLQERQPVLRERLIQCDQLRVTRISGQLSFVIGAAGLPRLLVCVVGSCQLAYAGETRSFGMGDVLLLPTAVGACACRPHGLVSLLEIALPELAAAAGGRFPS
jgi:mannose-6-phosphate isomerase